MLMKQSVPVHKIILMNTEQKYWNAFLYDHPGLRLPESISVHHLSKREFDHGRTRREGVKKSTSPIFVMMTQDALPADEHLIERLIKPLEQGIAAVSYARQLPRPQADLVERFTRGFNYPEQSRLKSKEDIPNLGIKTCFCSNVCAAYKRDVYDALGGFVRHAIFNEDMIYASAVIEHDYSIAYVAEAQVVHSHGYTNKQQFKRNFDLGVSQADNPEVFEKLPSESEGIKLVKQTAAFLKEQGQTKKIIPMCITSGYKLIGYKLGKNYKKLSRKQIMKCTMNQEYFRQKGL